MDPETLHESLLEILRNGRYRPEAEDLFMDEVNVTEEIANDDKAELINMVMSYSSNISEETARQRVEQIVEILMRSRIFEDYIYEKYRHNQ
jgi:hypothetical protein